MPFSSLAIQHTHAHSHKFCSQPLTLVIAHEVTITKTKIGRFRWQILFFVLLGHHLLCPSYQKYRSLGILIKCSYIGSSRGMKRKT
ncbi:uncharacterized protein BDZ83DRAFT_388956 [Colletotrichum acutatum]|uniref:Uncharacterized protein n=1 Tax=Glomerella acutata TaxID=27357 RepID=A0AAD8UGL2_GLOAC|nr:uncharacterized protein BDZ83DRAFT_388956 [Colletotrichum acutatum]KAK1723516.1 hypothetical protein BDZ83DRAFT_388956 [Colletotrichum acutatum]